MGKDKLLEVLNYIDEFISFIECGENYWIDPKGQYHTTDMGYGLEFWNQISNYLREQVQ